MGVGNFPTSEWFTDEHQVRFISGLSPLVPEKCPSPAASRRSLLLNRPVPKLRTYLQPSLYPDLRIRSPSMSVLVSEPPDPSDLPHPRSLVQPLLYTCRFHPSCKTRPRNTPGRVPPPVTLGKGPLPNRPHAPLLILLFSLLGLQSHLVQSRTHPLVSPFSLSLRDWESPSATPVRASVSTPDPVTRDQHQ